MVCFFPVQDSVCLRKRCAFILAFSWCSGLITGVITGLGTDFSFCSLMQAATIEAIAVPGLLIAILLPLFLYYYSLWISERWLFYVFVYLKAFIIALLATGLCRCVLNGKWLISFLFFFPQYLSFPGYLWLYRRGIEGLRVPAAAPIFVFLVSLFCNFLNYRVISPYLITILTM